jgi:hypothetical protein
VLLPGEYNAMLFHDEAARLDVAAREKLAAQTLAPITLVPESDIAALRKLVAAGRVRAGGPRCGKTPSLERAVRLHYPDAWAAQAETACMGDQCSLWLYVREPNELHGWDHAHDWPARVEAVENVKAVTDVAAFEAAFRAMKLEVTQARGDAAGGMIGGIGHGYGIGGGGGGAPEAVHRHLVVDVEPGGPWTTAPAIADLAGEQRRLDACPATKGFFEEALVDVDARGKVDRCETEAPKCLCDVLRGHAFPSGSPLRRARVRFGQTGNGVFGGGLGKLGPFGTGKHDFFVHLRGYGSEFGDDFDAMRAQDKGLQACFAATASPQRFDADVVMSVDEAGAVKDASVTKGHDQMTKKELACVTKWARTLTFSCETLGGDPARVTALVLISR